MMELHPFAAVETNIFGTAEVAEAAIRHGAEDFVLISSDESGASDEHDGSDQASIRDACSRAATGCRDAILFRALWKCAWVER